MLDNIVKCQMKDPVTEEEFWENCYLFPTGFGMTTMVKIIKVSSDMLPSDSMQVSVDCLGLDSSGGVFELNLYYTPDSIEQRDKLIKDLQVGHVYLVDGRYEVHGQFISIVDAAYRPVEPDFSEDEVREVFRAHSIICGLPKVTAPSQKSADPPPDCNNP